MNLPFIKITPPERSRTYHFNGGESTTINGVSAVAVSNRGNHRLETKDGGHFIISAGWKCLELDIDNWTF